MKKNTDTTTAEKPAKKLTAEQKAKAKEKLAKKRAALKEKKRLAREKKAAKLAKKRAKLKAARELKKQKKAAKLKKKRIALEKKRAAKKARLEKKAAKLAAKKAAKLAAKKAKLKELKAKQKAKAEKPAKVAVEKADLKNITTKDMAKEITKRLKTFAKVLADRKNDTAEREELVKRLEADGIQVAVNDGILAATLCIAASARVIGPKPQIVKHTAIELGQPKESAAETASKEPVVEAEATEIPIGDTYGNEPTADDLAAIEAEQDAEPEEVDAGSDNEDEPEEGDPRSEVDDEQADFRREFFGTAENTEDFE